MEEAGGRDGRRKGPPTTDIGIRFPEDLPGHAVAEVSRRGIPMDLAFAAPFAQFARVLPRFLHAEAHLRGQGERLRIQAPADPAFRLLLIDSLASPHRWCGQDDAHLWVPATRALDVVFEAGDPVLDPLVSDLVLRSLRAPTPRSHANSPEAVARAAGTAAAPDTFEEGRGPCGWDLDPTERHASAIERLTEAFQDGVHSPFVRNFAAKVLSWSPPTGEPAAFSASDVKTVLADLLAVESAFDAKIERCGTVDLDLTGLNTRRARSHFAREVLKRAWPKTFGTDEMAEAFASLECRDEMRLFAAYGEDSIVSTSLRESAVADLRRRRSEGDARRAAALAAARIHRPPSARSQFSSPSAPLRPIPPKPAAIDDPEDLRPAFLVLGRGLGWPLSQTLESLDRESLEDRRLLLRLLPTSPPYAFAMALWLLGASARDLPRAGKGPTAQEKVGWVLQGPGCASSSVVPWARSLVLDWEERAKARAAEAVAF